MSHAAWFGHLCFPTLPEDYKYHVTAVNCENQDAYLVVQFCLKRITL